MTELSIDINTVKGFLDPEEGEALYKYAKKYSIKGDCLEIGSYCGKSSVYLGIAVKENGKKLYSIDQNNGSEEQKPGEENIDTEIINYSGDGNDT